MQLDIDFVRQQFDPLRKNPAFVFAANAGGSYVARQAIDALEDYNRHCRVQPYSHYPQSQEAGRRMDRARTSWARALDIEENELTIGPSTSLNTYVVAQAIGPGLRSGDEIVVTNQDHEANSGVWRRMAEQCGAIVRQWSVDQERGLLNPEDLDALLSDRTRWVFLPHCSNITGTVNPVAAISRRIKQASPAKVFVDAVAYAPHHVCDMPSLEVDGYAFSLYKVYGPHQGLMYLRGKIRDELEPQCHYFNRGIAKAMFNPAGPQHAQVAACAGVIDYFTLLYDHHFETPSVSLKAKLAALRPLVGEHENRLVAPILDYLENCKSVRLIGKAGTQNHDRVPTIAFECLQPGSGELAGALQQQGIGCEVGHFYAHRLIKDLGIDPDKGVVRISLVAYNTEAEVEKTLSALDEALSNRIHSAKK